jgi:hypothetical protein
MTTPQNEHEQKLTISIDIFVPDHPDRTESSVFAKARHQLISGNPHACCYVCGTKESLELHHDIVEWCDADGIDWEKMKSLYPEFGWSNFDPSHPETFIDSAFNARLVLCKKHHTGKDHGIHYLPYPIWQMQRYKRADFIFSPDEEK